ncbi:hypothetical protein DE146DRAFT_230829 [Phaeosphaeria sp. MPI-PUGE-AT-0046c]|nr:hypothetical protein DE146DRAFT_230829 [Phaeosphaeria sp. MPI-PUGE-AT-0046c]
MPAKLSTGRSLLSLVAVTTSVGGYIADWNHTHVYNPRWPPHAKFHNGQTMSTGLLLGASALYYLHRSTTLSPGSAVRDYLHLVVWLLSLNWIAQLSAVMYPGSLPTDPEFGDGFPQLGICAVLFAIIGLGYFLERRHLTKAGMWHDAKHD